MADDKLKIILQEKLGALAKPILSNFERSFEDLASFQSARDDIADKLALITDKAEVMRSLGKYASEIKCSQYSQQIPDDKLHKYLQPILGTACTIEAINRLEEFNPELKGNEELRDKFIRLLEDTPDEDKLHMVAAALKISKIREVLRNDGTEFEFADAYKDFENITSRLLKNFYNIGKYAENIFSDNKLSDDEKMGAIGGPIFSAQVIMLNDNIEKDALTSEQAKKEIDITVNSAAGGMKDFKLLVQYIAEQSGKAAEIVFDTKEFRKFSKWEKDKTVQDAKRQALTGEKSIDKLPINDRGIQNG